MNKLNFAAILAAGAAVALSPGHLAAQTAPKPASLGVEVRGNADGAEVTQVLPGRSGEALGFKPGDILVEAGGKPISREVFTEYMKKMKEGDQMSFKVKRAGAVIELSGKALAAPEGAPPPTLQQVNPSAPKAKPQG